jgi:acylglycerol lipase
MKHEEGSFQGIRNSKIYTQCWLPESEPKAVLLIVHGVAEHSGRYMNVVNHLVPKGYAAYSLDHIGHGKSEGTRVHVERFEDYTDTLKIYFDQVRAAQPGKPVFLFGHSLGGLISAYYLLDHQAGLSGAVLSGPAIKPPDNISPLLIFTGKLLSVLIPKSGLLQLGAGDISRDPAVVQAYINDPLVYTGKLTSRLAAELNRTMQRVTAEASQIKLPLIIVQGGADKIVDPRGASTLYNTVGSTDKTIKIYDGFYHEVFNDPERERVLKDVENWLEAHLPGRIV